MVYRNYNAPSEKLLERTTFESTAHNLKDFLKNVEANYGWGNEAIEVAMQAINKEEDVDQVIIIADAAANTEEEVPYKRRNLG